MSANRFWCDVRRHQKGAEQDGTPAVHPGKNHQGTLAGELGCGPLLSGRD